MEPNEKPEFAKGENPPEPQVSPRLGQNSQPIRAILIKMQGPQQLAVELQGTSLIEVYGALSLVLEKIKKEIGMQ